MWGCLVSVYPFLPCDDWENIYTLSYYHHQIGSMNYYPLFRVRSWNNGVRCLSFYILSSFWIWASGLAFGISVPPTTNALHSNQWVSLYKLWNSCSWSEPMRNLELKWPCICTSRPNSNVLTHEGLIWIWCYNGYNVALDINLGINTIISRLLTYALLHTNKAIYPFTKRDEEVFFV